MLPNEHELLQRILITAKKSFIRFATGKVHTRENNAAALLEMMGSQSCRDAGAPDRLPPHQVGILDEVGRVGRAACPAA
jgi:hypothetical protein